TSRETLGIKLTSTDKKYIVQFRKNGFTFSIMNHYDCWESFSKKAKKLWKLYLKTLEPTKVTRVAVRYINRIDIPILKFNLEDYFETYPRVLKGNKGGLSGFFLQAHLPQKEGGFIILNQTITDPPEPGYTSIILDIDAYDLKQFEPTKLELWERIELLRAQKNNIFENSITKKTREFFK